MACVQRSESYDIDDAYRRHRRDTCVVGQGTIATKIKVSVLRYLDTSLALLGSFAVDVLADVRCGIVYVEHRAFACPVFLQCTSSTICITMRLLLVRMPPRNCLFDFAHRLTTGRSVCFFCVTFLRDLISMQLPHLTYAMFPGISPAPQEHPHHIADHVGYPTV